MTLISVKPKTWTRAEYQRLAETDLFDKDRVELFRGEIVSMSPHDPLHAGAIENLTSQFFSAFGATKSVRVQLPFAALDDSEPEPDLLILDKDKALQYKQERSHPSEAELIVEVARTSLNYDRLEKGGLYAEAGVPEYWIVNLQDMVVEVHHKPGEDANSPYGWKYLEITKLLPQDTLEYQTILFKMSDVFVGLL